jgi:hypothetical protein
MQDENHTFPAYEVGAGTYTFTADQIDTKFLVVGVRIATDGTDENIKHIANVLQPQLKITAGSADKYVPKVDVEKLLTARAALVAEYDKMDNTYGTVTYNINDVSDWEKTTYAIAGAWGLSPEDTAMYPAYALDDAIGGECYVANYNVPPLANNKGYFSITVYGEDKYLMSDEYNSVSSNRGVKLNDDNTFTVYYGAMECKDAAVAAGSNFAYTPEDNWGFLMRVYLPDVEGMYKYVMPEIKPVK